MMRARSNACGLGIGLILVGFVLTWRHVASAAEPPAPYDPTVGHMEAPVPPPAVAAAPSMRRLTPSASVAGTAGVVTFQQVNVAAGGLNIVGDAANEPSMAIDPNDTDVIAVGWRQFDSIASSFRQAGVAYSQDGGASWTFPGVLDPGQFRSDPVLGSDADGTFFYSSLSSLSSIEVFRSFDGGVTWGVAVPAFGGDKQWIAIDRTVGPGSGFLYQIWNVQFSCCWPNDFTRSTDQASSFQGPFAVSTPSMKWGTMDVGPDGVLYLGGATLDTSGHLFTKSLNAQSSPFGPTFTPVRSVDLGGRTQFGLGIQSPNPAGLFGQVWITADPSRVDSVYMLGSVDPPGDDPLEVNFVRSDDGGTTWSDPVRVNDDSPNTLAWQWFGTMAVAPNGRIDVVFYDTRDSGQPNLSNLYYTFSVDQGRTWAANRVLVATQFNSHDGFPIQNKLGDYIQLISDVGFVSLAFAATYNGEQDVWFLRFLADCDGNGIADDQDVLVFGAPDCNGNLIPDTCELQADCNENGVPDECDIAAGAPDENGDGIPDECACLTMDAPTLLVDDHAKSRYLSLVPGNPGQEVALRVTVGALDGFPGHEGTELWVGPPAQYPEEDTSDPGRTFTGAALQCEPYFRDWGTIDPLQLFGGEIVPGSSYQVHAIHTYCTAQIGTGWDFGTPLEATTGKFGDVVPLYDGDDSGAPQPDFNDIASVVAKFTAAPSAPSKARAQLQPNTALPARAVDFKDIAAAVSAFIGTAYADPPRISGPCTCPSPVFCSVTNCVDDTDCGAGYCVDGFCTDACGRCTPP